MSCYRSVKGIIITRSLNGPNGPRVPASTLCGVDADMCGVDANMCGVGANDTQLQVL
jgi:hypothetical protein